MNVWLQIMYSCAFIAMLLSLLEIRNTLREIRDELRRRK